MSEENKNKSIYLGNLSPALQGKFLTYYKEANKHGVTSDNFVDAWNTYSTSIEEHVFITETSVPVQDIQSLSQ